MSAPDHAMILAAGLGTRMRPLTENCPKPLLPVAGRAMIDHALDHATGAGVSRVVVNLHYLGEKIRIHLAGRQLPRIAFSDEQPEILETGGGIVHALPLLGENPFYCINSDSIWVGPNPLGVLRESWKPAAMDALLLLVARERAHAYTRPGDFFLDREGGIPRRRADARTAPYIFSGAQILKPQVFADAPSGAFSINLIWDRLIGAGRLAAVIYPGDWVDVGTPEGLTVADACLARSGKTGQ